MHDLCLTQKSGTFTKPFNPDTLISLITVEVGMNVEGCKSCKINWPFPVNFWARKKFYNLKWPQEKSSLGSVRISESFVMISINVEGGFFCGGWNFPKSVSMTSRLLERCEYSWHQLKDLLKVPLFNVKQRLCKHCFKSERTLAKELKVKVLLS